MREWKTEKEIEGKEEEGVGREEEDASEGGSIRTLPLRLFLFPLDFHLD